MRGVIDTTDSLITGPTVEPLDLDEVKKVLRFTSTSEDTLIDVWISAARQHFEEQTGRQLMTATWEYALDAFPTDPRNGGNYQIEIPHPPLQGVTSLAYDDGSGVEQIMDPADYVIRNESGSHCKRGRVVLAATATWPGTSGQPKSVRIRYQAGYGDAPGDVPELCKGALYFLVGHFHQFRAEVHAGDRFTIAKLPFGAEEILRGFRYSALPTLLPRYSTADTALLEQAWV